MNKIDPRELADSFDNLAVIWGGLAKHSATIAHARRVLYEAYLAEGFTDGQALELCKVLST
jgi:hypothetical protein